MSAHCLLLLLCLLLQYEPVAVKVVRGPSIHRTCQACQQTHGWDWQVSLNSPTNGQLHQPLCKPQHVICRFGGYECHYTALAVTPGLVSTVVMPCFRQLTS